MKRISTKVTGVALLGVMALAGAACEASGDSGTSPGQEVPAEGGVEDPMMDPSTGGDAGTGLEGEGTTDGGF